MSGHEVLLSLPVSSLREAGDEGAGDMGRREASASGLGTEMGTYAIDASGRPVGGGEARGAAARLERDALRVPAREDVKIEREGDVDRGGTIGEPDE